MRTIYFNRRTFLLFVAAILLYFLYSAIKYLNQSNYSRKQASSLNHTSNRCINEKKYIRFECKRPLCEGWADRLRGLMGAYIWAIFTKRKFLIDIDFPCSLDKMLEPNVVKWNKPIECYEYGNQNDFFVKRLRKVGDRNFYLSLRNLDIFQYYNEANLIIIQNNLDWIYSFSSNPNLVKSIQEFGYEPQNFRLYYFFKKLYNDLFKLAPSLQKRYDQFLKEAKPNSSTKLICAQIRIGGRRPNVAFDRQFMPRNSSKLYWNFIERTFIQKLELNNEKYKIFITTDTESVEAECIRHFGKKNIVKFDGPFVHIDREILRDKKNCSRIDKVILDFHALQNCDMAVISQSGFARLGISNRLEPTKDLYRFQIDEIKLKKQKIETFIFKKINSLMEL